MAMRSMLMILSYCWLVLYISYGLKLLVYRAFFYTIDFYTSSFRQWYYLCLRIEYSKMLYQIEFLTLRTLTFERHQDIRKQFCLLILMFTKHLRLINDVNSRNSNNLWLNPSFSETRWMDRIIIVTQTPLF